MLKKHKRLTKKELKKDPLVIFIAQAVDFLRNEWLKIVSTVLVVIIVITVSFFIVKGKRKGSINAYDVALTALRNDAPEALDLLKRVAKDYGGSRSAADALIHLGNEYYQNKDFDSSEKFFNQYIDRFSDDPIYTFTAYNGLGGIYEEKGEYGKAGEIYEKFISGFKLSVFLPLMYLKAGKAYFNTGDKEAARRNFIKITENYKDSKENQEATFFLDLMN